MAGLLRLREVIKVVGFENPKFSGRQYLVALLLIYATLKTIQKLSIL